MSTGSIATSQGPVHLARDGHAGAPRVLLVHGGGATHALWRGVMGRLARGFDLAAPDLRGVAGDAWRDAHASLDDEAARLVALADALWGVDAPVHIVGHCFGAGVALRLALALPRRVASVALIDHATLGFLVRFEPDGDAARELRATCDAFLDDTARGDDEAANARTMAAFIDRILGAGTWTALDPLARSKLVPLAGPGRAQWHASAGDPTTAAELARLATVPGLLAVGATTLPALARGTELLHACLPWPFVTMPGAGHAAPLTHPADVARVLERHLLAALERAPAPASGPSEGTIRAAAS